MDSFTSRFGVNFLHYGTALDVIENQRPFDLLSGTMSKRFIIQSLRSHPRIARGRDEVEDIIRAYGTYESQWINLESFKFDCENSLRWRSIFAGLNARGFSFHVDVSFSRKHGFGFIQEDLYVVSILADPGLYYIPRVRQQLEKFYESGRLFGDRQRPSRKIHKRWAICWALVKKKSLSVGPTLIVVNMQSDVASANLSPLRGAVRGWQRILLHALFVAGTKLGCLYIAVPPCDHIHKATAIGVVDYDKIPYRLMWNAIYDGSAEFFNMRRIRLEPGIDIQTLIFRQSYVCREFFVGTCAERYSDAWSLAFSGGGQSANERTGDVGLM